MTKNHSWGEDPEDILRDLRDLRKEQVLDTALASVVIPCYNQAHFLCEAIESVIAQSYPNFEIVVVDDGSTDNTFEVAARYQGVRCIRQNNQGLSAARNSGLRGSRGDYLVFLDADDRLLPNALEVGLEYLKAHPECAFVSGYYRLITIDGAPFWEKQLPCITRDHYIELLRTNYIGMHATVMYRRSVFESVGGFDTSLKACEDYNLYLRIARHFPVHCHSEVVAEYRDHGSSMSRNSALMLKATLAVLRSQRKYVRRDKRYKKAYRIGVKFWQDYYGPQLAWKILAHVREREWKQGIRDLLVLLRYYPRAFHSRTCVRAWKKLRLSVHLRRWLQAQ